MRSWRSSGTLGIVTSSLSLEAGARGNSEADAAATRTGRTFMDFVVDGERLGLRLGLIAVNNVAVDFVPRVRSSHGGD
jgi:hypothetical protein